MFDRFVVGEVLVDEVLVDGCRLNCGETSGRMQGGENVFKC